MKLSKINKCQIKMVNFPGLPITGKVFDKTREIKI